MIRVGVVDDQQLVRSGIRMLLEDEPDVAVVAEGSDGDEVPALLAEHADLDVLLLDLRMARTGGMDVLRSLARVPGGHRPRIVVLTTFHPETEALEALELGACGFLLKDASATEFVAAVRAAHSGSTVLTASAAASIVTSRRSAPVRREGRPGTGPLDQVLTEREQDIVRSVATGATNAEIAAQLFISENTVKMHLAHILGKLDLRDRVQLVALAYRSGFLD
ncbi:MAG: response regulator [Dermatophilaceae bacterium]